MENIQAVLGDNYLAEITNWPDYVKSEDAWDFAERWHYTTIHPDQGVNDVRERYARDTTINDAIEAIEFMIEILEGDELAIMRFEDIMEQHGARALNNSTEATALAFLVHLVGDIHQPLHVGKNRDLGGNKITVLFFNDRTNLHSVWDTKIIEHERLSYTEFAYFIDKWDEEEVKACQDASLDEWARESIKLREHIYNNLYNYTDRESGLPSFSWRYQHDYIYKVRERLLQGGLRLAGILESIYG